MLMKVVVVVVDNEIVATTAVVVVVCEKFLTFFRDFKLEVHRIRVPKLKLGPDEMCLFMALKFY